MKISHIMFYGRGNREAKAGECTMDGISREEHNEFAKRMDESLKRTNARVRDLEKVTEQISNLTSSVKQLATSVESMAQSQSQQSAKLEELENRDGEMWRQAVGYVVTCIIGIVVGFVFKQIGM